MFSSNIGAWRERGLKEGGGSYLCCHRLESPSHQDHAVWFWAFHWSPKHAKTRGCRCPCVSLKETSAAMQPHSREHTHRETRTTALRLCNLFSCRIVLIHQSAFVVDKEMRVNMRINTTLLNSLFCCNLTDTNNRVCNEYMLVK